MAGWLGGYIPIAPAAGGAGTSSVGSGGIAAGSVTSGVVSSGAVTGQAGGGFFTIASGTIGANDIASGAIVSGRVASGQIGGNHIASGVLQGTLGMVIDGGGSALASGLRGYIVVPYNCTLNYVNLFSDQSGGSVFLGLWKDTYANFPPTSGDTIAVSGVPLISGAIRNTYSGTGALAGWTTTFTKGDVIGIVVHSGATMTQVSLAMQVGVNPP